MSEEITIKFKEFGTTRNIELVDLTFEEYCSFSDLAMALTDKDKQFTKIAKAVQIRTGKTDEQMMEWKNDCKSANQFNIELIEAFKIISQNDNSKKKS